MTAFISSYKAPPVARFPDRNFHSSEVFAAPSEDSTESLSQILNSIIEAKDSTDSTLLLHFRQLDILLSRVSLRIDPKYEPPIEFFQLLFSLVSSPPVSFLDFLIPIVSSMSSLPNIPQIMIDLGFPEIIVSLLSNEGLRKTDYDKLSLALANLVPIISRRFEDLLLSIPYERISLNTTSESFLNLIVKVAHSGKASNILKHIVFILATSVKPSQSTVHLFFQFLYYAVFFDPPSLMYTYEPIDDNDDSLISLVLPFVSSDDTLVAYPFIFFLFEAAKFGDKQFFSNVFEQIGADLILDIAMKTDEGQISQRSFHLLEFLVEKFLPIEEISALTDKEVISAIIAKCPDFPYATRLAAISFVLSLSETADGDFCMVIIGEGISKSISDIISDPSDVSSMIMEKFWNVVSTSSQSVDPNWVYEQFEGSGLLSQLRCASEASAAFGALEEKIEDFFSKSTNFQ